MYSRHNHLVQWFHSCDWCSNLIEQTRVQKLMISAFIWCTGCPSHCFSVRVTTWSLDLISCDLSKDVLQSASWDHGTGRGILRQTSSASSKWGCDGILKILCVDSIKRRRPTGHLCRFQGHFWRSFDRRRQPRSCAGNGSNEAIIITSRPLHCKDLSLNAFGQG